MNRTEFAIEALNKGGYLAICGNAARARHPKKGVGVVTYKKALHLVESLALEISSCSSRWPFADRYVLPPKTNQQGDE